MDICDLEVAETACTPSCGPCGRPSRLKRYDEALADADRAVQIDPIILMRTPHVGNALYEISYNTGANRWEAAYAKASAYGGGARD